MNLSKELQFLIRSGNFLKELDSDLGNRVFEKKYNSDMKQGIFQKNENFEFGYENLEKKYYSYTGKMKNCPGEHRT